MDNDEQKEFSNNEASKDSLKSNIKSSDNKESENKIYGAKYPKHDLDFQSSSNEIRSKVAKSSPSHNFVGLYSENEKISKDPLGPGKVGLENLGNTCYFNSGVQCLAHLESLVNYFEFSDWKSDLNTKNLLGMHGEIAIAFSKLLHCLWESGIVAYNPIDLKTVMGKFAPQFSGSEQQDAHELITFLLDGIHEDLNKIIDKPIVENVFGNGHNDNIIAEKSWNLHKLRNDSIIVDIFHGQLRSKLDCPLCKSTTTVFDPYVTLSIPLMKPRNPNSAHENYQKRLKITFIPYDFSQQYKFFTIDVLKDDDNDSIEFKIRQKAKSTKQIIIGRYYSASNEIIWGLSEKEAPKKCKKKNVGKEDSFSDDEYCASSFMAKLHESNRIKKDDDSGEYIAFEIKINPDYNQYWIPCFLKMNVKNFCTVTEKNVIGPFLLPAIDDSPNESELSDICETVISSIWEEYPESDYESESESMNKASSQTVSESESSSEGEDEIKYFKTPHIKNSNLFSKIVLPEFNFENGSLVRVTKEAELFYDERYPFLANNCVTAVLSKKAVTHPHFSLKRLLTNFNYYASCPLSLSNPFFDSGRQKISVEKCLSYFSMEEYLDERNTWFCPHCRQFVCAKKKIDIWSTPKNLILHLKRFVTEEGSAGSISTKVATKVDYPLLLDMDPFIIGPHEKSSTLYRLKSVSEHFGSFEGGHYTTLALVDENYKKKKSIKKINHNKFEEYESDSDDECMKWYSFNDSMVSKVSKKEAASEDAYILFYERVFDSTNNTTSDEGYKEEETEEEENDDEQKDEKQDGCQNNSNIEINNNGEINETVGNDIREAENKGKEVFHNVEKEMDFRQENFDDKINGQYDENGEKTNSNCNVY